MRHGQAVAIREAAHAAGQQAETRDVAFLGRLEQQLHADADAEQRLAQAADRVDEARATQARHAIGSRADAGQDDMRCGAQRLRVRGEIRVDAESLDRVTQRRNVGAAAVDDRQPYHSVPFVLGSSVSVTRNAWRSARPTPLKQASIM